MTYFRIGDSKQSFERPHMDVRPRAKRNRSITARDGNEKFAIRVGFPMHPKKTLTFSHQGVIYRAWR